MSTFVTMDKVETALQDCHRNFDRMQVCARQQEVSRIAEMLGSVQIDKSEQAKKEYDILKNDLDCLQARLSAALERSLNRPLLVRTDSDFLHNRTPAPAPVPPRRA